MFESIRETIANWIAPADELAETKGAEVSEEVAGLFGGLAQGRVAPVRGANQVLRAYSEMPALRQVVERIASAVAATPWHAFRIVGADGKSAEANSLQHKRFRRMDHKGRQVAKAAMLDKGELEEIDHPIVELLEGGNACMAGYDVIFLMQSYIELLGEAAAFIERNPMGMPVALWPIPPTWVADVPGPGEDTFEIDIKGKRFNVKTEDLFWLKSPDPWQPYGRGSGVAKTLSDELDSDEYAAEFVKAFFYNNGLPSAILAFEKRSKAELKRLEADWLNKHRGHRRAHQIRFLTEKPMVHEFGKSFREMSFVDLRKFLRSVIRETWGVPPEILGFVENSNRATINSALYLFMLLVIVPRLMRWRREIQRQIVPLFDDRIIADYENPVPEDRDFILEVAKAASWSRARGEWRQLQELPVNEGDNVYLQPLNLFEQPVDGGPPKPPPITETPKGEKWIALVKAPGVELTDVDVVINALRVQELNANLDELWEVQMQQVGDVALADLGLEGTAASFNMINPAVTEHLENFSSTKIVGINDVTRDKVRAELVAGVEAGEGHRQLAKRLNDRFAQFDRTRSRAIAQTESSRSGNFTQWAAQDQSGVVPRRRWLTIGDDQVRDAHELLEAVVVGIKEEFVIPSGEFAGESTMYPGNFGTAALDINERCTTIAEIEPVEEAFAAWCKALGRRFGCKISDADLARKFAAKAFAQEQRRWEKKARAAIRNAFVTQEKAVLDELRRIAASRGRDETGV